MKVALLCNMNNNYFGLLRYMIDEGVDTTLFVFADEHPHFRPENDTWYIGKWETHIDQLDMKYDDPFYINKTNIKQIKEQLKDFDILIGSGPTPAYLHKAGLRLDIFFPYKVGLEYTQFAYPFSLPLTTLQMKNLKRMQYVGLKKTRVILNQDIRDITLDKIKKLKVPCYYLGLPFVYNETVDYDILPDDLKSYIDILKGKEFVVMHHGRHLWKQEKRRLRFLRAKGFINNNANDWVIRAFKKFIDHNPSLKNTGTLVLFEYGPQVHLSKALIAEIGIENNVLWIKKSPRKHILELIKYVSVGIGDVAVGFWGGKTSEFMVSKVPVLNSLSFETEEFEKAAKKEIPPLTVTNTEDEIFEKLNDLYKKPEQLNKLGQLSKEWFNKYDGVKLTKKIIYIAEQLHKNQPIDENIVYDYN